MATSSAQENVLLMQEALKIYFEFFSKTFKQHILISIISIAVSIDLLYVPEQGLSIF